MLTNFINKDSIIFDLDGTLWDASTSCTKAWNKAIQEIKSDDYYLDEVTIRSFSGLKIEVILEKYLSKIPKEKHQELLNSYHIHEKEYMKEYGSALFSDVREVLSSLYKKHKLFIVSNCLTGYIENFLSFHNLESLFIDFESSGNTGLHKSENIKLIIKRNHLKTPVYIGDTIWDSEAAQKASVPFIYAEYGFGNVPNSEIKIEKFKDLNKIFSL